MSRSLMLALVVVMLLAAAIMPAAAYTSPCNAGIAYFQPDGGDDMSPNNGTKDHPFKTRAKAESLIGPQGGCVFELDVDGDQVGKEIQIAGLPPTGVPMAQEIIVILTGMAAIALISLGVWLRRRGMHPSTA